MPDELSADLVDYPACPRCETNLLVAGGTGHRTDWYCWNCSVGFDADGDQYLV